MFIYLELNKELYNKQYSSKEEYNLATIARTFEPGYRSEKAKAIETMTKSVNETFSQSAIGFKDFKKFENTVEFFKYAVNQL
jgi:hypothetical protein